MTQQDLSFTVPHEIVEEELNAISRIWSAGKRLVTRGTLDNGTPFEIHVTITRNKEDFFEPDEQPISVTLKHRRPQQLMDSEKWNFNNITFGLIRNLKSI